jgi:TRAP-type C4-dicarboxylate transport system permease small subunit
MKLSKIGNACARGIHWLTNGCKQIAAAMLFVMMLLVAADVTGRYVFNKPIKGTMEIEELMMVVTVFLSLAYCTFTKGHITVELLLSRLSRHSQAILNSVASVVSILVLAIIIWQMGLRGWLELLSPTGRVTMLLNIPVAPFILLAAIGCVLMALESLLNIFHLSDEATGTKTEV